MKPLPRRTTRLASGALLIGALLAAVFPTSAMAAPDTTPDWRAGYTRVGVAAPPAATAGQPGVLSYDDERYGYKGTFRDGTKILDVNWFNSGRWESFGIAPDRTIWHAWPDSGGWRQMPGNGRADHVTAAYWNTTTGIRIVEVYVSSNGSYWCNTDPGNGRWGGWWNCT